MMRAPDFRYHAARSVADAARALKDGGPEAMLLAGGTDLVPNLKRRQQTPKLLVGIRRLRELRRVRNGHGLELGSARLLSEIAADRKIARDYPALARAAGLVATPQIRNMGTLGGNLCLDTRCTYYNQSYEWRQAISYCMKAPGANGGHACTTPTGDAICWVATSSPRCWAVSSSDTAPALIALGARVTLASSEGERDIALEELYADDGMAYLTRRADEILTAVRLPPPTPRGAAPIGSCGAAAPSTFPCCRSRPRCAWAAGAWSRRRASSWARWRPVRCSFPRRRNWWGNG